MTTKKFKLRPFPAFLLLMLGFLLLIYMVVVEKEPGAIPLILIITGTLWIGLKRLKMNKRPR